MASIAPQSWLPIFGDFHIEPDLIRFLGQPITPEPAETSSTSRPSVGLAMCDLLFGGGSISMSVEFEHTDYAPAVQAVLFRDPASDARLAAGLSSQEVEHIVSINEFTLPTEANARRGWASIAHAGTKSFANTHFTSPQLIDETITYKLRIHQRASIIEIFVNEILLLRHRLNFTLPPTQCGIFCQSKSEIRIRDYRVDSARRRIFVIMQFSSPFNELYSEVIKPVGSQYGFAVERADEVSGPGIILADILKKLTEADIVIADLTPQNENVFYELGFSHGIGKPTILLADRGKKLPFDISPFRTLFYDNTIAGKTQIEEGLKRHISAILTSAS